MIRTHLRGRFLEFFTSSSVFSKERVDSGTRLLIESMVLPEKGSALDVGCGYGPVGIAAALSNPKLQVVMVDVNKRATRLAEKNAQLNNVTNVQVLHGFLYEPIADAKFETILCNPPLSAGMKTVRAIIAGSPKHMLDNGLLQLVVRSRTGGKLIAELLSETFGNVETLARKSGYRVLVSKKS
jgi:16S rRNA G1207 methylase RsmC